MTASSPGFYGRLARWVLGHRAQTVWGVVLLTVVAGLFATRLRVDSDILALMPENEPSTQSLRRLDQAEGGVNVLTIAVDAEDAAERDAYMDALQKRIEAIPGTDYVLWRLAPDFAWQVGVLQIPVADLEQIRDRLKGALSLGAAIANPFIASRVLDLGPMTERLANAGDEVKLTTAEGVARMVVRPSGSAHDLPFARTYMHAVDAALAAESAAHPGVNLRWVGGAYRHNVEDYEGIVSDIGWITGASFVMVLIIIAAAFRSPRALVVIFLPLIVSNVWTLGIAGATVGALNTFTSFVNAVLIGLGVEFGVHLYSRYQEIRAKGHSVDESVIRAWDLVGSACTSACLTSSAGFAALMVAQFAGFRQLGWLLSLGLLLCLVAEILLMPVLLSWLDHAEIPAHLHARHKRPRRRPPATYRLAPMALLVIASVTGVSGLLIGRIRFEYDLSELRRAGLAYADLSEKEKTLARDSYSPLVVTYPTEAALDAAVARFEKKVADHRLPEIAKVLSVRTLLPADQDQRVRVLNEIAAMADDPNVNYLPASVIANLKHLAASKVRALTAADLPEALQHILGAKAGQHRLLLIPSGNMWDMREAAHLADVMEVELKGVEVAGEYLTLGVLFQVMQHDAPVIGLVALVLVCVFTGADLRQIRPTLGALGVLLAGMCWWGALLVLSDIRISIVNFVGVPIVLGIGVDVMIHLIHRMKQEGPGRILKALSTTGWASALGTSTTVVAFAALSLASSQGVRSLGLLVLLGESAVTVAGFILVPLGFATTWRLQGRTPAVGDDTGVHELRG